MARGAGEPSTNRAKADEAKEEEDPLVRRKEEVVRLLEKASAMGKSDARAKKELLALCSRLEAKNEKLLRRLPPEMWQKILDENLDQNDFLALAMTCRFFREKQKDLGKKMETNWNKNRLLELRESGKMASHTLSWFRWVCDTFEIKPGYNYWRRVKGAVNEGNLVNYAALQGSVEILRWLVEEKGCKLNGHTGEWAGMGGSTEVLGYVRWKGYELHVMVCAGAARQGHLEALKFLRSLDPPCPWNWWTCAFAALGGHLEVLKWARDQDPPCPWRETTCSDAARKGHLDVLKWVRDQDPPCPWIRRKCRGEASKHGHDHVVQWIDQQEDESDCDIFEEQRERERMREIVLRMERAIRPLLR
ncbi:ankyrin repeat domain-containing protein [Chloropicon roscoffensis]|uniref:Ankyrin repeat domain-containing protein n=1 Tax=Chloropicon roscoffensis TaxID=1461544 RepID=A0AAX4P404_9CHLO